MIIQRNEEDDWEKKPIELGSPHVTTRDELQQEEEQEEQESEDEEMEAQ